MNISKKGILFTAIALLIASAAIFMLFRYYNFVNHPNFLNHSKRSYVLEIQQKSTEIKNKIPISLLVADLGLDFEFLNWVLNNFSEEVLIGLSPYVSPSVIEFISGIKNDVYVNIPIKGNDPTQNSGELEIIVKDYDENNKKIITILSISDKIRGIYLKDIADIAEDKKTLEQILELMQNNQIMVIAEKSDAFQSLIDQENKLRDLFQDIFLANVASIDGENIIQMQNSLKELEDNYEKYKHVILFVPPSFNALNEVKNWLEKQDKFILTRALTKL